MSEQRQDMTDEMEEAQRRSTDGSEEEEEAGRGEATSSAEPEAGGGGNAQGSGADVEERAPLLPGDDAQGFRQRWENLQREFVDQPREVVEHANDLVSELMQAISAGFNEKRSSLEAQWERGDDVSTEDLRIVLKRYRSFFNRLLSA
jgi:hypothetical protein